MDEIILIGGGGHCKSVIDVIEQEGRYKIAGIIDKPELLGSNLLGYSIFGNDSDLPRLKNKYKYAMVTIGQIKFSSLRKKLFNLLLCKELFRILYFVKYFFIQNPEPILFNTLHLK